MGGMCFLSCKGYVLASGVHIIAILIVVFCVICSLLVFVSDTSGDHIAEESPGMGLVTTINGFLLSTRALQRCGGGGVRHPFLHPFLCTPADDTPTFSQNPGPPVAPSIQTAYPTSTRVVHTSMTVSLC